MFRAGLVLLRRLVIATSLLILLVCGAEVGVRAYEAATGKCICRSTDITCSDPSKLAVPSLDCFQELKRLTVAKVECRDSNEKVSVQTNSLGLRGAELAFPKPPGVCRIVVLGDETILAPETHQKEHFCTLLRNHLQEQTRMQIEVVNAGIPGHCPLSEFLMYKLKLMNLNPDLVILHFDWSDVADDRQVRRQARCDASGVALSCPNAKLVASKKFQVCDVWRQHFRILDWGLSTLSTEWKLKLAMQKAASREMDTNPYAWLRDEHPEQNFAFLQAVKPIADLAQLCKASHCPFVLMTSPKPWQVSAKCSRGAGVRLAAGVARDACYLNRAPFKALTDFAESEHIPYLDCSSVMAGLPQKGVRPLATQDNSETTHSGEGVRPRFEAEANYLRYAPRWSPAGHRQAADLMANFLIEKVSGAWNSPYFRQSDPPATSEAPQGSSIQWTSGEKLAPYKK